jgi:hypothetical protein
MRFIAQGGVGMGSKSYPPECLSHHHIWANQTNSYRNDNKLRTLFVLTLSLLSGVLTLMCPRKHAICVGFISAGHVKIRMAIGQCGVWDSIPQGIMSVMKITILT